MKIKDMIKKTIASNVRRARIASGMTQAEAADKLGITAQAISNFERGVNGIENSLLLRMCKIYNTTMSNLLGEEYEQRELSPGEFTLTDGERMLIDLFRQVPEDKQQLVLQMIRAAIETS